MYTATRNDSFASTRWLARGAAAIGLLVSACNFGAYHGVVGQSQISKSNTGVLAASYDGSTIFLREAKQLRSFDVSTGALNGSFGFTSTNAIIAVAPSADAAYTDAVWTLDKLGARALRSNDLSSTQATRSAIPMTGSTAADSRTYCDLDLDMAGGHYVLAVDTASGSSTSYLYREATAGAWERASISELGGSCGQVSVDDLGTEVLVLAGDEIVTLYQGDLSVKRIIDLSGLAGNPIDIASAYTHVVVASRNVSGTTDALYMVTKVDDSLEDTVSVDNAKAVYVNAIGGDPANARAVWSGLDTAGQYRAGYWALDSSL